MSYYKLALYNIHTSVRLTGHCNTKVHQRLCLGCGTYCQHYPKWDLCSIRVHADYVGWVCLYPISDTLLQLILHENLHIQNQNLSTGSLKYMMCPTRQIHKRTILYVFSYLMIYVNLINYLNICH